MLKIQRLIDEVQCYELVRELRWPEGIRRPKCGSTDIIKRGYHDQ